MPVYSTEAAFLYSKIPPVFGQKEVFENGRDVLYYWQGKVENRRVTMPKNGPCRAEMIKHPTPCRHNGLGCMRVDPHEDTESYARCALPLRVIMSCMRVDPHEDTERGNIFALGLASNGRCMRVDPHEDTERDDLDAPWKMQGGCMRVDPHEDTERHMEIRDRDGTRHCCMRVDPHEDTERLYVQRYP